MMKKIILLTMAIVLVPTIWYLADLPDTSELRSENPQTSAIREYREKQFRQKGKKPQSRMIWRSLDRISPHLLHAVVLSEDDTFYRHQGFDFEQTKRAMKVNWERKRFAFGGSR